MPPLSNGTRSLSYGQQVGAIVVLVAVLLGYGYGMGVWTEGVQNGVDANAENIKDLGEWLGRRTSHALDAQKMIDHIPAIETRMTAVEMRIDHRAASDKETIGFLRDLAQAVAVQAAEMKNLRSVLDELRASSHHAEDMLDRMFGAQFPLPRLLPSQPDSFGE